MERLRKLIVWTATGFGLGCSPFAPGTAGCLLGVPLAWLSNSTFGVPGQIALAVALSVLAVPICDLAERSFARKDDHRIVADEFLTFPISMIGLPLTPWVVGMAFVSNRCFDILKLPPARGLQRLPGGLGITIDDVFAALYSLACNHLAYRLISRCLFS
jgi:phosphatidylglycerophosphatase A